MSSSSLLLVEAISLGFVVLGIWMILRPSDMERFGWWHFRHYGKWAQRFEVRTKRRLVEGRGAWRRQIGLFLVRILGIGFIILGLVVSTETGWHTFPVTMTDLVEWLSRSL